MSANPTTQRTVPFVPAILIPTYAVYPAMVAIPAMIIHISVESNRFDTKVLKNNEVILVSTVSPRVYATLFIAVKDAPIVTIGRQHTRKYTLSKTMLPSLYINLVNGLSAL